jgi:hypothetical protein
VQEGISDDHPERRYLLVRQLQELRQQAKLVQHLERRGMHRIASEVAEKVYVPFEHGYRNTTAGQEKAQHHAGGSAAYDTAGCLDDL